jgi:hypothetical protein
VGLTDLSPHAVAAALAALWDESRWEEIQALDTLRRFRAECEVLHTHLLPFAKPIAQALQGCLKMWGGNAVIVDETWRAAECASCMLGLAVGPLLVAPFVDALMREQHWRPRRVRGVRKMIASSGLTVPLQTRWRLEYESLLHLVPLLAEPVLTPTGSALGSALLQLLTVSVATGPFLRQSPYLAPLAALLPLAAAHSDPKVRSAGQRGLRVVGVVAHPTGAVAPLAALTPDTAAAWSRDLPTPAAAP